MRYAIGMPLYRLERLHKGMGVSLAASMQWEQMDHAGTDLEPVYDQLVIEAAQAQVRYIAHDATMRVRELRMQLQSKTDPKRTGIFTRGIVGKVENHWVTVFFTGRCGARKSETST